MHAEYEYKKNKKPKHKQYEEHRNYIMNIYAKFTTIFIFFLFL